MPSWHSNIVILIACFVLCTGGAPTPAEAGEANSLEIAFVPEGTSSDGPDLEGFGIRYTHRFDGVWGIQAAYYRDDVAFADDDQSVEVSARLRLFDNNQTEIFTYFGGGFLRYERFFIDPAANTIRDFNEIATAHAGFGAEFDVADRFFIRPDVIYRRFSDIFGPRDDGDLRASIAVGVRF